jgi:DNA/RNA-binding domain of Phe-tRNA-synthetase-like protein
VQAYQAHYRPFGQTYHVVRQLESVALKGRDLASPGGALVSAMFAAELDSLLLTAGHDVDALVPPLVVDCSQAGDRFVGINGQERELKPGDMLMRDALGIISAVLHGPDQRTRFAETTTSALFVTYAPKGIARADVQRHLDEIAANVRLTDPSAEVVDIVIL